MPRRLASAVCAAALVAVAAPAAVLAEEPGAGKATSFAATFSVKRPASATGVLLRTTGEPPAPPTTAPPVVRQTVTLLAARAAATRGAAAVQDDGRGAGGAGRRSGLPGRLRASARAAPRVS